MNSDPIDASVYPDVDEPPTVLETAEDKADYIHRICSAWDYGVHPEPEVFSLFAQWKDVFDRYPVATSPAYHAFRIWFRWEPVAFPATKPSHASIPTPGSPRGPRRRPLRGDDLAATLGRDDRDFVPRETGFEHFDHARLVLV